MQLLWLCLAALLLWVARLLTLTLWRHRGSDAWLRRLIALADADEHSLAVDCTSPVCPSLTHHRGGSEPALASGCALACAADTSGGLVLAAAAAGHPWLQRRSVACNHFDMDALVAVFAALQPADALRHADVLSAAAHLGDFREVLASPASSAAWAAALLLNVWANSVEATRFSRPFDGGDGPGRGTGAKWDFFLPRLPLALAEAAAAGAAVAASAGKHEDTMAGSLFLAHLPRGSLLCEAGAAFCAELERVWAETALLRNAPGGSLVVHADVGLAVVSPPPGCCPLHYYSLFGPTAGCDAVLSLYGGRLYELELKYTGFVQLRSRRARHRLNLAPLAAALSAAERAVRRADAGSGVAIAGGGDDSCCPVWVANSIVDSGPLLRLQAPGQPLTKAARYGHPHQRPWVASRLSPGQVEAAVVSFLRHGYAGEPPRERWSWADVHDANARVDWAAWTTHGLPVSPLLS